MTGPLDGTPPSALSAPPPWTLEGRAIVCVARAKGGAAGILAFARYTTSPVGPYDEVLWVPRVTPPFHVAAIRVSSPDSVAWGRRNWGIPKERAAFSWEKEGERWSVHARDPASGDVFALLEAEGHGPSVTVATGWVPAALRRFEQPFEGRRYRFSPSGRARGRAARVTAIHTEGAGFPEIEGVVIATEIEWMRIVLPAPTVGAG